MAESAEHEFLSTTFLEILEDFSALDLYGYREADRRRFDFAATLTRDWSRPLAGQTLWAHAEGIDKDLRMLLADSDSDIKPYLARDNVKNRARIAEVVEDFKRTPLVDNLYKLRLIWVPDGFDADEDGARETMRSVLRSSVVDDILFNVVFGRLSATDVQIFISASGLVGLPLALLCYIAENTIGNIARPSEALGVSAGPLRERLLILQAAGFVGAPNGRAGYTLINEVTPRGRVFLDLLGRIEKERASGAMSPELRYVLGKLGLTPNDEVPGQLDSDIPRSAFDRLLLMLRVANEQWGVHLDELEYQSFPRLDLE